MERGFTAGTGSAMMGQPRKPHPASKGKTEPCSSEREGLGLTDRAGEDRREEAGASLAQLAL